MTPDWLLKEQRRLARAGWLYGAFAWAVGAAVVAASVAFGVWREGRIWGWW